MNTQEFIQAAVKIHGDRYDYSQTIIENPTALFIEMAQELYGPRYNYDKVDYIDQNSLITITDTRYGDFQMTPKEFLTGIRHKYSGPLGQDHRTGHLR